MYEHSVIAQVNQGVTVNLIGAMFFEVPASQPLHYRPMNIHLSQAGINALQNVTEGGAIINEATLREIANDIIRPSDTSRGEIGIQGGWGTSRCSVFLNFEIKSGEMTYYEVLTGYTATPEIGANNTVANHLLIIPNSLLRVGQQSSHGSMGQRLTMSTRQNQHVLTPIQVMTQTGQVSGANSQRPTDLLVGLQNQVVGTSRDGYDPRQALNKPTGVASDRVVNSSSAKTLNRILTSWSQAAQQSEKSLQHNDRYMIGLAATNARENDFSSSQLFTLLGARTQFGQSGAFTWQELCGAVAGVNWQAVRTQPLMAGMPNAANMASWGGFGEEVKIGNRLTQAVPSIVTQVLGAEFSFTATKDIINNTHAVLPEIFRPMFEVQSDAHYMHAAVQAMANTILPEIIPPTVGQYQLKCHFVIGGDMFMEISLDGKPPVPLIMPCYCDSLSSMNIATSKEEVDANGQKIGEIIRNTFVGAASPAQATALYV
ncbi:hypothetical protein CZP2022_190 [Vibrio phage C-ZP2022]|nr:hypothetical protein CZP2022_190 [Vibrio phage C-ZP2022]